MYKQKRQTLTKTANISSTTLNSSDGTWLHNLPSMLYNEIFYKLARRNQQSRMQDNRSRGQMCAAFQAELLPRCCNYCEWLTSSSRHGSMTSNAVLFKELPEILRYLSCLKGCSRPTGIVPISAIARCVSWGMSWKNCLEQVKKNNISMAYAWNLSVYVINIWICNNLIINLTSKVSLISLRSISTLPLMLSVSRLLKLLMDCGSRRTSLL